MCAHLLWREIQETLCEYFVVCFVFFSHLLELPGSGGGPFALTPLSLDLLRERRPPSRLSPPPALAPVPPSARTAPTWRPGRGRRPALETPWGRRPPPAKVPGRWGGPCCVLRGGKGWWRAPSVLLRGEGSGLHVLLLGRVMVVVLLLLLLLVVLLLLLLLLRLLLRLLLLLLLLRLLLRLRLLRLRLLLLRLRRLS